MNQTYFFSTSTQQFANQWNIDSATTVLVLMIAFLVFYLVIEVLFRLYHYSISQKLISAQPEVLVTPENCREYAAESQLPRFLNWLPALTWALMPLSFSVLTIFGTRPTWILTIRWVGLVGLTIAGLLTIGSRWKWKITRFDYLAFFLFGFTVLVSISFSESSGTAKLLSCILVYFYLTWGVGSLINNFESAISITEKFLITTVFLLGLGLIGNLTGLIPPSSGAPSGLFPNPNGTAALATPFLPLSIWYLFSGKGNYFKYIPLTIIFAVTFLSGARNVWGALLTLLAYITLCEAKHKNKLFNLFQFGFLVLISLLVLIFLANSDSLAFREASDNLYRSLTDQKSGGITSYRSSLLWPLYLQEIGKSFTSLLVGHGWGSEEIFILQQRSLDPLLDKINVGTAHSAYIGLTFQIGLIGSFVLFGSLWTIVIQTLISRDTTGDRDRDRFQVAVVGSVLMMLMIALFETGIYNMGALHAIPAWFFVYVAVRTHNL
jgi:hypothetical protein